MADGHYLVLARKWRPQTFEDVVGQEHITRTLQNAIRSGRIGHAFLFIGSRGVGKTTSARILAKALNCTASDVPTPTPCGTCENCTTIASGTNIDVLEIDGASNNSVEDVRQIRENVRMVPSSSRYKIYVIDEVHQLSLAAFNALLKTLEEPPAHAVFILATTEAHKIPATIISRCQRFDFRRVGQTELVALLRRILDAEGIDCEDDALLAIARAADGGVRDAESILDQLVSYCEGPITFQDVFDVLGLVNWQVLHDLCDAVRNQDIGKQLTLVNEVVVAGKDLSQFVEEIVRYYRNLLVVKSGAPKEILGVSDEELAGLEQRATRFTLTGLIRIVEQFAELIGDFDSQLAQRTALETLLIKMSKRSVEISADTVLEKIMQLSESGSIETVTPPSRSDTQPEPAAPAAETNQPTERMHGAPDAPTPDTAGKKTRLTKSNLDEVWPRIREAAARDRMNLATWLSHARAVDVDGDQVVIELDGEQDTARTVLAKPESRAAIEESLCALTENVTTFRIETAQADDAAGAQESDGDPLLFDTVDLEQGTAALQDPHIGKVLDVFKGQIVDLQQPTQPKDSA
ncbi:MAG: DNA polymerase III subunit gamma/tau [Candidatus Hydrogenedentes bacterium]|nr:DNA polymerase III subunit gamma/tau [Candidatus Hydrogenedentota bacterium]